MSKRKFVSLSMKLLRLLSRIKLFWSRIQCEDCNENDNPIGADGLCHFCAEDRASTMSQTEGPN